jgi:glycine dehydrogenase
MVDATGFPSLAALIDATVPTSIRRKDGMLMGSYTAGMTESQFLDYFKCAIAPGAAQAYIANRRTQRKCPRKRRTMASKNKVYKSFIGMGYYGTHLPPVIQRNVLENPGVRLDPFGVEI